MKLLTDRHVSIPQWYKFIQKFLDPDPDRCYSKIQGTSTISACWKAIKRH